MKIIDYTDNSYVRDSKDKKLIDGYCFFLVGELSLGIASNSKQF